FVPLAAIPLTVNGKLDRRALPEPAAGSLATRGFLPPEGREEQVLAEVWASVLQVERVGRDDNFFALGGDSILSLRVISKLREQGLELTLQQLFQTPTPRELARALGNAGAAREQVPPFGLISGQDRAKMPPDVEDAYPLALLQAGMVFHTEQSPETAAYHDIFSYHLRAPFDPDALRAAIDLAAERHPVLRTSFALTGFSEPLQLVHRDARPPLSVDDLRHFDDGARADALRAWMDAEKRHRFTWSRPPLLRFQVHRLTGDELQLSVSFHHAILDGWSVATLLTELFQQYLALLGREASVPPAPVLPYREFVAEERRALESGETLTWWMRKLGTGTPSRLARWPFTPDAGARQVRLPATIIDRETTEGLRRLADTAGVPLKSVLLAAHLRVVSLWSGDDGAVTGLVSNGRSESGDGERVLGLFLNTVPFRVDLAAGTWTDLVRQVFHDETEMLPHRRYPMADLQRRLGGQPLFETSFNYVNFHVYEQLAGFSEVQVLGNVTHEEANFPLSVLFGSNASGLLDMGFDHDTGQLDVAQVLRIAATHAAAFAAMAANPGARWDTTPLLSRAEIGQILSLADGGAPAAGPGPVHRWFERLAAEAPDALAVVADEGSLTRGELERRSNQVARALRSHGVRPGTSVALAVGRTPEMPVALLAVWKAGGAWVPLDPSWPPERLTALLEDSAAALLVTTEAVRRGLTVGIHGMPVLSLDTDGPLIDTEDGGPLAGDPDPEDPAYLIYTSGSTGRPKAVVVPHRGLGNLAAAQIATFGIAPGDRLLQFASLSFDASVSEVVTALLGGAELHLAEASRLLPGPDFVTLLRERRITHLTLSPSVLAAVPAAALPDLATLVVAG
ncbi:MAG TPA: condensation domain-containing protein, partial [Thermoanaerobaculia bacterium]|nr:condensation domain-containing protein [Thermoanaerobaculia bacterium]